MSLDQNTMELIKWFGGGFAWLLSMYITYVFGKKSKHDDIQIKKRHDFAEQILHLLQQDFSARKSLLEQYHANFDHMNGIADAMDSFLKYETLYMGMKDTIESLPDGISQLKELNQKATIYFNKTTTERIDSYIKATVFSYHTDGIGLINNYAEAFFTNLLEEVRFKQLLKDYEKSICRLRKEVK